MRLGFGSRNGGAKEITAGPAAAHGSITPLRGSRLPDVLEAAVQVFADGSVREA